MIILESILIAFSMFSAIPMPQTDWNSRNMRFSLCAFPLVGVVIGLCCYFWARFCIWLSLPGILRGGGLCLLPLLITGGIHLDGYADTCDALACHGDTAQRQAVLKDPHLGAFAVIHTGMYMIADFALCAALPQVCLVSLLGLFGLSRSLSGLALTVFPLRPGSGLARSFADAADRRSVRLVLTVFSIFFAVLLCAGGAALSVVAALFLFLFYRRMCSRLFGGLSGDLAGWFLQLAELWMLGMLVLSCYVGAKL